MGRAKRGVMTPERFWLATALFHVMALLGAWRLARRWRDPEQCGKPLWTWATLLAREVFVLAVFIYGASLAATVAANVGYDQRRIHVGPITLRLLGQAIFPGGRTAHRRAGPEPSPCAARAAGVRAGHRGHECLRGQRRRLFHRAAPAEGPPSLGVRRASGTRANDPDPPSLGPADPEIGAHERRALAAGLAHAPDLIVLTGDYVQDSLGRPTELEAAADLRLTMKRIGFGAPLGVFATEGDVGPSCAEVFAGTEVHCLVDDSEGVTLPDGTRLAITGLCPRARSGTDAGRPGADPGHRSRSRSPIWKSLAREE